MNTREGIAEHQRIQALIALRIVRPERACTNKRAYLTKSEARKAANSIERRAQGEVALCTYKCPFADHWHLTRHHD